MTRLSTCWALALTAVLVACGGSKDAGSAGDTGAAASVASATPQSGEEQLADVADYQLTMDKYDKYLAAQRNIMRKFQSLSPAEREALDARNDAEGTSTGSLDDMARKIEREPVMNAAVREAGLSAREFSLLTMSIMQSGMAAGIQKMRPKDDPDSLARAMKANPASVKFVRDNEAELTRKQNELQAEMKRLEAANPGT